MTGRMQVTSPDAEIARHTHAIVKLASGSEVRFVDPRRFGRLAVVSQDSTSDGGFTAPGDEPLDSKAERFIELFHGRKTPIKSALAEPETAKRRGQYLRRRIALSRRHPASTPRCRLSRATSCASSTPPCRKCCARPSHWAARPLATMLMPMAKKAFSNCSTGCTVERANRAWFAERQSNELSSRDEAVIIARAVRSSCGQPEALAATKLWQLQRGAREQYG